MVVVVLLDDPEVDGGGTGVWVGGARDGCN